MKWRNCKFAHRSVAETVYDEMVAVGVFRVSLSSIDDRYVVSWMPITQQQLADGMAILDKYVYKDAKSDGH